MFVKHAVDYTLSSTEQHLMEQPHPRQRTTAGPAMKYQLESLRLDKPSAARAAT
ncbi:hypothetical protein [Rhodococcus jostii]|uniref:hypothetical protein n=1 Tax=Rhodococcus jostii TaxID=132919 RepID=UPI00362B05D6